MYILVKEIREMKEKTSKNYKVIYKCRNCGKLFERSAELVSGMSVPTAPIIWTHKCDIGVYGYGDIQASIANRDEDLEDKTGTKDYIPKKK